jgi:Ca2+-binding RTX toxin-like protein
LIAGDAWNANVIMGEGGNDIIHGNGISSEDQTDFLAGGDGNDQLYGKGSALLIGDAGDDLLQEGSVTYDPGGWLHYPGASAGITVRLGAGTATGQGNDTLVNITALTATPYDDVLLGDGGPNYINGGSGNDVIRGWRGADYLVGGISWDDAENGNDALYGGAGPDHLSVYDEDGVRGGDRVDGQRGHDVCARNRP